MGCACYGNRNCYGFHVLSDATIAIAYFTIPFALVYFVSRRHDWYFAAYS